MKLQEILTTNDLEVTADQIKAFFLGIHSAERPLPFSKALAEILADTPEHEGILSPELKVLWSRIEADEKKELADMFPQNSDLKSFLETALSHLDYFLTGMSLSGTSSDSCKDEELLEFVEVIEEFTEDLDEYLSEDKPNTEEGELMKNFLLDNWSVFVASK